MTREIEHRLWIPSRKRMYFPNIIPNPTTSESSNEDGYYMLWTGILDVNGKKVFENDIIRVGGIVGEIVWVQEHCAFMLWTPSPSKYYRLKKSLDMRVEVIGNKWENGILMEVNT